MFQFVLAYTDIIVAWALIVQTFIILSVIVQFYLEDVLIQGGVA